MINTIDFSSLNKINDDFFGSDTKKDVSDHKDKIDAKIDFENKLEDDLNYLDNYCKSILTMIDKMDDDKIDYSLFLKHLEV